ncbi:MAG: flagellar biosynthetic protein FliR [Liquorilactobacillus nagelii]|jgi:flagellar biosynthetic protein FliR|uniref:Flagellar biosynthetic protein FliR n=2 Tax=Liquorilactobacillus nagelii TaxID=82688 RepID=A0A3Q8CHM9_9LACO|nr:flagellar biosynthetic protein FliR [Liquorilactobacillus nagelii]AUJ33041.1 flagellar biosynthetic protein FliR [Liquorilactobacillus nagelii]MCI1700076.1 flagellar biosynthetic protein FliR [Liquorilactobacillus nagelii]ULQ48760.1 flagellar biosynthetic protein FliR [Liquorilactobacillus nagelii]
MNSVITMAEVQIIALLLCRIMSFLAAAPIFSQKAFPNLAKIIIGFSLIIAAYPIVAKYQGTSNELIFILLAAKEILVGLAMGYLSQLVFNAVMVAGQMIDFQVGFSIAQAYDATFQMMSSQFGRVYYWLATAVFFMMDFYQQLIIGVVRSFKIISLTGGSADGATIQGVVRLFCQAMVMSLELAAPMVVAMLVVNLLLGVISRSIPQINVLMLSLPLQTVLSFLLMLLILPNLISFFQQNLPNSINNMMDFVRSLK